MNNQQFELLINNLPIGYGLHEIILDSKGSPIDYLFIDVNPLFEKFTGLKKDDVIGKTILQVLPNIVDVDFNWIEYYGNIALNNEKSEFIQYSDVLGRSYKITVFSPEKLYFITLFSDFTEQLKDKEQLHENEMVFHKAIQEAPIPIMIHAEDGEVIDISKTWTDISGYSHTDIPTITEWTKFAYGIKQDEVVSFIEQLYDLKDRQHDGQFWIQAKNGKKFLWDFYSTYLGMLPDGRKMAMSVALDVTKRNKLEEDLLREKQLSELTLLSVGDGVITTDKDGKVTLLNEAAEILTGWSNEQAIGKDINEVFSIYNELDGKKCDNIVEKVVDMGVTQELANHTILYNRDGSSKAIADSASPIRLKNGDIYGVVIVFRDYSEKYEKEQRIEKLLQDLQNTQILLESSLESPKDIIIISLDKEYRYLYFNKSHMIEMKNAYNTDIQVGDCIFDFMTSDEDIKNIKHNYDLALSGKSHVTLEKYGDIQANYYETKFNPIFNLKGEIFGLTVFAENVTERIVMKNRVVESEKRYKGLVENLDAGVVIHAPDTTIITCNEKASKLLGLEKDLLTGKYAGDPAFSFVNEDNSKMELDKYPVNVIKNTGKPIKDFLVGIVNSEINDLVWVSANGIPIYDEKQNLIEIVISFTDVSEVKKSRKALEYAAYNDYLTGLHNRRYYEENIITYDKLDKFPLTIVMADINGLKLINDAFGHSSGDELLIAAAKLLQSCCREEDLIARVGGDEFVILMPNTTELEAGKLVKLIQDRATNITIQNIPLSISFGYVAKHQSNEDIMEVFRSAEDLMYREKLLEIPSMRSSAIETILHTLYEKDQKSELHSRAVSKLSERLAQMAGLPSQDVVEVKTAGLLHDIGKIIIPTAIINKQGLLTTEEYTVIKSHPEIGFRILNSTQNMRGISNIVLNHHERWDGTGYPRGIKKEDIPIKSRIISIADAFDAMTSERSYRMVLTKEAALEEIMKFAGTQFDPKLAKLFALHFDDIVSE